MAVFQSRTYTLAILRGTDGYAYAGPPAAGGAEATMFDQLLADWLAEMSAATSVGGVAPGAVGAVLYSNGSSWVRSATPTLTSLNVVAAVNADCYTINGVTASSGWFVAQNTKGLLVQNSGGSSKVGITLDASNVWQFGDGLASNFNAAVTATTQTLTAVAPTVAAGRVGYGGTVAATGTNGTGEAMKANVEGYLIVNVAGTQVKVPYVKN